VFSGRAKDRTEGVAALHELLANGQALARFRSLIEQQGGDPHVIDAPRLLPQAALRVAVEARAAGTIRRLDALAVGRAANALGAGRTRKEDAIDPAVGAEVLKKVGDSVRKGEPLVVLHVNDESRLPEARRLVESAYEIDPSGAPCATPPLIVERVLGGSAT
jgi:pyrimidine-nucleoside phosphorylase